MKYKIEKLIQESKVYGVGYREWRRRRKFIAHEICSPGSFLDIGCANGFLIKCLIKWASHNLVPYGIDIDETSIDGCRNLFPHHAAHFVCMDIQDLAAKPPHNFPPAYDYVFWNIPNAWSGEEKYLQLLQLHQMVKPLGKLIVAIYGSNHPGQCISSVKSERKAIEAAFSNLKERGVHFTRITLNPRGTNHYIGIVALTPGHDLAT